MTRISYSEWYRYIIRCIRLAWRLAVVGFSLRNEGSYLGNVWYVLNPLLLFGVLFVVFAERFSLAVDNYVVYLVVGVLFFNFFTRTTTELTQVMRESGFMKSFSFPREALVLSVVIKHCFIHMVEVGVFAIFFILHDISLIGIVLYALCALWFAVFLYGLGLLLALTNIYITDIGNVWQFFTLLLLFATPIFYVDTLSRVLIYINAFNPLSYFLSVTRDLIISQTYPTFSDIYIVSLVPIIFFLVGQLVFNRFKTDLAEHV